MTIFRRSALLVILFMGSLLPTTGSSQDTIRVTIQGTVLDSRSRLPIPNVEVTLAALGVILMTDSAGAFLLPNLALGTYRLALQKGGYEKIEGPLQVLRAGGMVIRLDPLAATVAPEFSRIQGIVKDLGTGEPLEGALVTIGGRNQITAVDGRFALTDIPAGQRRLEVSLLGYATRADSITVPAESILILDVGLTVEPIPLPPITVSVEPRNLDLELAGFYGRRDREQGVFLTREAIEERNPITTVDLLDGIPGVRIIRGAGPPTVTLAGSRAMSLLEDPHARPCYPSLWMNGMLIQPASYDRPVYLGDLVSPWEIEGMEVYQSAARIPIQYNIAGACGVIVIWTRSGGGREQNRQPSIDPGKSGVPPFCDPVVLVSANAFISTKGEILHQLSCPSCGSGVGARGLLVAVEVRCKACGTSASG